MSRELEMSAQRRRDLLDEAFAHGRAYREIDAALLRADGEEAARLVAHRDHYHKTLSILLAQYAEGVPRPAITRCPFTSTVVHHSIDIHGLDGFWWNFDGAARPREEGLPRTWFALTGAVRLAERKRVASFLCKPGPEVPYVLPRMLEHRGITAVISAVPIEENQGYAIAYFAKPVPWDLPRVNTWGANHFWYVTKDGNWGWDEQPLVEEDMDFDLAPWVESGKLRWISPGDSSMKPHKGLSGFPYLDLPGRREILRIENGAVWTRQEVV
jgi:hypothetical protein